MNELRYKIIGKYVYNGDSRTMFEKMVSDALEQGYKLYGNPIVDSDDNGTFFYQAVYLPRDEAQS